MYKLASWVEAEKLTSFLSRNPRSIKYLEENPDKIDWFCVKRCMAAVFLQRVGQ